MSVPAWNRKSSPTRMQFTKAIALVNCIDFLLVILKSEVFGALSDKKVCFFNLTVGIPSFEHQKGLSLVRTVMSVVREV